VGVFGSGPLMEAQLLKDANLGKAVDAAPQLQSIQVRSGSAFWVLLG